MYLAVLLRAIVGFQQSTQFALVMILLLVWAITFGGAAWLAHNHHWSSNILIGIELLIIVVLLFGTYSIRSDLFAFLFGITIMQVMRQHSPVVTASVIAFSALVTYISLFQLFGVLQALALALVYSALSAFLAAYIWTSRQTMAIQAGQVALSKDLRDANIKLEDSARTVQQLATSRERQRLARELHDSVTQTIFSMTLATQTARMSMKKDGQQVAAQLDRVEYLAQSALSEMQVLVSQLAPEDHPSNFLDDLRQHLVERQRRDNLLVNLKLEGDQSLSPAEETCLFRIVQEALNNIVKHASTTHADLRLHLAEPFWVEIEDHGIGFDPGDIVVDGKLGLAGMQERAHEIGWSFDLNSTPGQGTLVRIQKGS